MANHNGETDLWLNPCNASFSKESKELTPAVLKQLIRVIYQTANNALTNAKHNVEEYVQLMNKGDTLQSHHDSWKLAEEPFLYPEGLKIPKQFNESIESFFIDDLNDMDLLKTKDLSKLLLDTFERFQHLAVGIQVLLNDTKDDRKNQRNSVEEQDRYDFIIQSMTNDMKSVLCEIYSAIWSIEIEIPASRTITIDVMPESKRVIEDRRDRNLRDWIIYREYMNQLQFAVIVFDILEKRIATN